MPVQDSPVQRHDFVFVEPGSDKRSGSRGVPRACLDCKRKKKRCIHHPIEGTGSHSRDSPQAALSPDHESTSDRSRPEASSDVQRPHKASRSTQNLSTRTVGSVSAAEREDMTYVRFIGDLNPEAELLSGSPEAVKQIKNSVGVWHSDASGKESGVDSSPFSATSLCSHFSPLTRQLLVPIMNEQCLDVLPPEQDLQGLETFFFANIYPILPAVDEAKYRARPPHSADRILQAQTICLMVHTNIAVRKHLKLPGQESPLSPTGFALRLLGAMRFNIELALTTDKAVLIRTLTAMSLFAFGRETLELTSQFFVRAVHMAYTVGLHLQRGKDDKDREELDGLFCYVWSIDRLQAALQGRPVIMHEQDMPIPPIERLRNQSPELQVLTRISIVLEKVIALYRPRSQERELSSEELPSFEEILSDSSGFQMSNRSMATLELYYHAVSILSCRTSDSNHDVDGHRRTTPNPRQSLAAIQVTHVFENNSLDELVLLPFVPYALSLSLSTAYREMRSHRVPSYRSRARSKFDENYRHVARLGEIFWSAALMAELGYQILRSTQNEDGGAARSIVSHEVYSAPGPNRIAPNAREFHETQRQTEQEFTPAVHNAEVQNIQYLGSGQDPAIDVSGSDWDLNFENMDAFFESNMDISIPYPFMDIDLTGYFQNGG